MGVVQFSKFDISLEYAEDIDICNLQNMKREIIKVFKKERKRKNTY